MAMKKATGDKFANLAYLTVTESGTDTLTFAQLQLASNLMSEKAALIIHRAEFTITNPAVLNSTTDYTDVALTLSDRVTLLYDFSQPELLFYKRIQRIDFGTAAAASLYQWPMELDFTQLPGGGLLVPADRLYIGIKSGGSSGANGATMRLFYTVMSLDTTDYWELIDARRVMTT
jgi:hypothetical protein